MANKTTQKQRLQRMARETLANRVATLRSILAGEGITVTDEDAEALLSGPILDESERRGWVELHEFEPYELADMADRLQFTRAALEEE